MVLGIVCTLFMIHWLAGEGASVVRARISRCAVGIDVVNGRERFHFGSVDLFRRH